METAISNGFICSSIEYKAFISAFWGKDLLKLSNGQLFVHKTRGSSASLNVSTVYKLIFFTKIDQIVRNSNFENANSGTY